MNEVTQAAQVDELTQSISDDVAELNKPAESAPADTQEATTTDEGQSTEQELALKAAQEGSQKAINKQTAKYYTEKRRADDLAQQLAEMQKPTLPTDAPKLEDFEFDEGKHQEALIDYKVNKKAQEIQQNQQAAIEQQRKQDASNTFNSKVAEFGVEDYEQTVANIPQLPGQTLEAVMSAGPQVAYYLGKHLDVADEVATLDPVSAAIKLGQISAQLANTKPTTQPSAAPDPIKPIESGGSVTKNMEDMSMEEIMATP